MKSNLQYGFTLGDFHIRPLLGRVVGPNGNHHLQPKVVDVLMCLVDGYGAVVERGDILREVWGDPVTSDEVLNRCISELRHAFDDHPDDPKYIQTVPKRGYRLIGKLVSDQLGKSVDTNSQSIGTIAALWQDLKDRNVVRVALAYSAASWLLLQVAQVMIDALQLPDWSLRVFVLLLGVGFLIAVIVAWVFQLVPEKDFEGPDGRRRIKQYVDVTIIGCLAIAVALLSYRQVIDQPLFPDVARLPPELISPEPGEKSVAVLRFASFGGDTSFSNGLGEHLLNLLARIRDFEIPSRQVTWEMSDQHIDLRTIAKDLRVRYLLEGSVQQQAQRIRVTAQLIDGESGNHVWSETYDEVLSAENFFNIQDSIAHQVVDRLEGTFSKETEAALAKRSTDNDLALGSYLEGREELNRPKTQESLTAAVSAFEESIENDPHYAEAHAGLCEANLAWYVTYRDTDYFALAEASCIRALRINSNLGEVYAALGSLHRYGGQYDEAESELKRARILLQDSVFVLEELGRTYRAQERLVLAEQTFHEAIVKDPANWSVYKSMGNFLFRTGRYQAALPYYRQVTVMQRDSALAFSNIGAAFFMLGDFDNSSIAWQRSLEIEPTHFAYMNTGNSFFYQGKFEQSVEMYRNAIDLGANDARSWGSLAASCEYASGEEQCVKDAYSQAIEQLNEMLAVNPFDSFSIARLAAYQAKTGDHDEARNSLQRLGELNWNDPDVPFFSALAYVSLNEPQLALAELRQALVMGYPRVLLAADPMFQSLRGNADFNEMSKNRLH